MKDKTQEYINFIQEEYKRRKKLPDFNSSITIEPKHRRENGESFLDGLAITIELNGTIKKTKNL